MAILQSSSASKRSWHSFGATGAAPPARRVSNVPSGSAAVASTTEVIHSVVGIRHRRGDTPVRDLRISRTCRLRDADPESPDHPDSREHVPQLRRLPAQAAPVRQTAWRGVDKRREHPLASPAKAPTLASPETHSNRRTASATGGPTAAISSGRRRLPSHPHAHRSVRAGLRLIVLGRSCVRPPVARFPYHRGALSLTHRG